MHVVIFCGKISDASIISNELLLGICDFVNARTRHNRTVLDIDEKNIYIDIRPGNIDKSAGLRPNYVLFYNTDNEFTEMWRYSMHGRFTELNSLDELIELVIKETPSINKSSNFTRSNIKMIYDSFMAFSKANGIVMGIDESDDRLNIIKYVFYHLISAKACLIIMDYEQVEDLNIAIDLVEERLRNEFNLED